MISFIVINLVLSAFISATTAKAAILLPIFMVVAAIYVATGGETGIISGATWYCKTFSKSIWERTDF